MASIETANYSRRYSNLPRATVKKAEENWHSLAYHRIFDGLAFLGSQNLLDLSREFCEPY